MGWSFAVGMRNRVVITMVGALPLAAGCNSDPCLDDGPIWLQNDALCPATSSSSSTRASSSGDDPQTTTGSPTTGPAPTSTDSSTTTDNDTTSATTTATTTSDTSTTAPPPDCGDTQVDPGEDCDDGNKDDTDACTNTCKSAACGDGIVGPGEACDDANNIDDDDCSNICAAPGCGDGVLQNAEQCDDANNIDTDACLNTCKLATCGDGVVHDGLEACDDANNIETDTCTFECQPPSCGDMAQNGDETDLDCGGSCDGCAIDQACLQNNDCASDLCDALVCAWPTSCLQIHQLDAKAPSAISTIDPDGSGDQPPIEVYCDQTTDGGGWTLIFKLSSGVAGDPSALWNGPALNENDVTLLGTSKSDKHYVSGYITSFWNSNGVVVKEARAHAYEGNTLAKFWKFDATATTKLAWFDPARLTASSYLDLLPPFNYFSILGDDPAGRRFYINRNYAGCPGDLGWLNLDTAPDPCTWETHNGDPAVRILYAPGTTLINWTTEADADTLGVGDVFAVFVR